jgi:hypothetical protein
MRVNLIKIYIILIYFKIKNILKNKYNYIFKHTTKSLHINKKRIGMIKITLILKQIIKKLISFYRIKNKSRFLME